MTQLKALIERLRSGEMTFDEFVAACVAGYARRSPTWPDDDGDAASVNGISAVTVDTAVHMNLMTRDEAKAIYAAVGR